MLPADCERRWVQNPSMSERGSALVRINSWAAALSMRLEPVRPFDDESGPFLNDSVRGCGSIGGALNDVSVGDIKDRTMPRTGNVGPSDRPLIEGPTDMGAARVQSVELPADSKDRDRRSVHLDAGHVPLAGDRGVFYPVCFRHGKCWGS